MKSLVKPGTMAIRCGGDAILDNSLKGVECQVANRMIDIMSNYSTGSKMLP